MWFPASRSEIILFDGDGVR